MDQIKRYMPIPAQKVLSSSCRFKTIWGGRGSGKSTAVANYIITKALSNKRILCGREFQLSLKDSVHKLLCNCIENLGLQKYFIIQQDCIKSIYGAEIVFYGLKNNPHSIKSLENISIAWIEEAETISEASLEILTPTIRAPGSEIIFTFNPETEKSPVYQRFVIQEMPDSIQAQLNYNDNEYFPESLRGEMEYCKKTDIEKYNWIWLGKLKKYAEDLIFRNKIEVDQEFETPSGVIFYYGLDFGFSDDPLSANRLFVKDRCLYIDYEVYGRGIELDDIHKKLHEGLPDVRRWKIVADSQRPDTISFLNRPFIKNGITYPAFNIIASEKGKGSVEDGIEFLRSFEKIYIHKRCPGTKEDYQNYRWKRHPQTSEILPVPVDKANHAPDNNRYALEKLMKAKVSGFDVV